MKPRSTKQFLAPLFLVALLCGAWGCESAQRRRHAPMIQIKRGQFGRARAQMREHLTDDRGDRRYLLDRMELATITLADGYPRAAEPIMEEIFETLRTQGINRDKTVASVVINEDLKFWKGEPFEQALAMAYVSMQQGMLDDWDNMRAAASGALFNLRDFRTDKEGKRLDDRAIAARSLIYERAVKEGRDPEQALRDSEAFNSGYAVKESNFVLGYLLHGIASQQMGRDDEARDFFAVASQIEPALKPLADELARGGYNTILVVSYGLGPEKIGVGSNREILAFRDRFSSDRRPLAVRMNDDRNRHLYPIVCDVNTMADDHVWNSLEGVRKAKSAIGDAALLGGAIAAGVGANNDSDAAVIAGLGAVAAGLFLKAGAHVDTRHCETFPQRIYLVPLRVDSPDTTVELMVDQEPISTLRLAGLRPPSAPQRAQLRYVRLVSGAGYGQFAYEPPTWATSGQILYSNPSTGEAARIVDSDKPYILGGRDVRIPDEAVLDSIQAGGYLSGFTLAEFEDLYRTEGLRFGDNAHHHLHLLEGGRSLAAPLEGTTGFARIFGREHPNYRPRNARVRAIKQAINDPTPTAERGDATGQNVR